MTKYEPLQEYLSSHRGREVAMTFAEVEKVLGTPLPASAYNHRPWWANDATGHAHAKAWLEAGFHTERVDMEARRVVFVEPRDGGRKRYERHPVLGALKGLGRAAPGADLTEPADPEWGKETYGRHR